LNFKNKKVPLRCTLTGCESSYPIKIPSKQLKNQRTFSTVNTQPKLNPWFVTGLVDAEGSFFTSIFKSNTYKLGWYLKTNFAIGFGKNELSLLLQIQEFFGGIGSIIINKNENMVIF
jgi:hypothetical protein